MDIYTQLPLDPPVLMGFLVTPTAFAPGFAINLEVCAEFFGPFAPPLPAFLLLTGNPIKYVFSNIVKCIFMFEFLIFDF